MRLHDWSGYEQLWVHFFGLDGDGLIGAKAEEKNIILTGDSRGLGLEIKLNLEKEYIVNYIN